MARGNGEGSIRHRADGRWEGRYTVGRDPKTGKQVRRSIYGKTRAEVRDRLNGIQNELQTGSYFTSDGLLLGEWLHHWLWKVKANELKPRTHSRYVEDCRVHIDGAPIAKMKIADIRRHHVQAFIDDMKAAGNSPHAVCYSFGLIRNAMNEAVNRGIIPVSYAVGVALPKKTPKKTVIFTKNEQAAFMDTIKGHRLEAAFILAITTGMREGELAGLMWSDYNKGRIAVNKDVARVNLYDSVTHEKTGSRVIIQDSPKTVAGVREIPLLPIAIDALKRHRMKQNDEKMKNRRLYADNGLIFCNEIGCIYEPTYYYKLLQKTLDRVGLKRIKFHALRATFATRGLEAEIPTKSIQSMLGHETPEMTMHYQQLLEEQALVEIAKLEKMF